MLYNAAFLSVLAASTSLVSVSVAAPVNTRQFVPTCPAGTQYYDFESTSGFKGCTATPAEYQNGPRKYWGTCPTGHGNWYVCATGFKGCTTDTTICDSKSSATGPAPWVPSVLPPGSCPVGQNYYVCATGFKGCSSDTTVCDPKPVDPSKLPEGTCPTGQNYYVCATGFKGCSSDNTVCDPKTTDPKPTPADSTSCPAGQNYYVCATGFKGCTSDTTVCDPKPPVKPESVDPLTGSNKFCPAGTSYYDFESTSGFKGCTCTPAVYQNAPRVYWGSCPVGLGNWYVCANGFKGCNTNAGVCDLKA